MWFFCLVWCHSERFYLYSSRELVFTLATLQAGYTNMTLFSDSTYGDDCGEVFCETLLGVSSTFADSSLLSFDEWYWIMSLMEVCLNVYVFPVLRTPHLIQFSRWGFTSTESAPLTCWPRFFGCSPGYNWLSGLWGHIANSCPAHHPPVPPRLFQQGCAQSFPPPACTDSEDCLELDARSLLNLVGYSRPGPTAQAYLCPSRWHTVYLLCWLHPTAWGHQQIC